MTATVYRKRKYVPDTVTSFAIGSLALLISAVTASAQRASPTFYPGNLVVSRSVYMDPNNITPGVTVLPPSCSVANCPTPVTAVTGSAYPFVWNNDGIDASFGITSPIFLDQISPLGSLISSLQVPNSSQSGVTATADQMVTSFSSKSEIALNLSTDGNFLTLMGYMAPVGAIDVSNSNTPGVFDPTDPVGLSNYRVVAQVDQLGKFHFTLTNAYSGNNGRAAILNNTHGANVFYTAGNAGNGSNPQPDGIIIGAGAQIIPPQNTPEAVQSPGLPTPVASFNITQLGLPHDKIGKDTNFRGMTVFNNVLYYTKGSGGNGVNTVYFVDTTGTVCNDGTPGLFPANGVGLPVPGASLPTAGLAYNPATLQTTGLPDNMCILKGFPTLLANSKSGVSFPFGIWFANATTLYVADEGNGTTGKTVVNFYTPAATANPTAGLQKWILQNGQWTLAYTLTANLGLGQPYPVRSSANGSVYPTGLNNGPGGTGFPWAPATDGLRNITGVVNGDGTVTIYAITSTISGNGDQGADPNELVVITDQLNATGPTPPRGEYFTIMREAAYGEVLRGVSLTPGTPVGGGN